MFTIFFASFLLGVDFRVKTIELDGKCVALQLWDTAGQERFRSLTKSYFRRADGVILMYDVSNERTFTNIRNWIHNVEVNIVQRKCVFFDYFTVTVCHELLRDSFQFYEPFK